MKPLKILVAVFLAGGWGALLFSVALHLLFWRVDNEPGAAAQPGLLDAAVICAIGGALTFAGANLFLILKKEWKALRVAWVMCILLLCVALNLVPLLLILLV